MPAAAFGASSGEENDGEKDQLIAEVPADRPILEIWALALPGRFFRGRPNGDNLDNLV